MTREMKNSGVEWIGDIPSEWKIIKNKYLLNSLYSGGTPSSANEDFYSENGVAFVSISDMSKTKYIYETKKKLTTLGLQDKNLKMLPIGTILYSIYATIGEIAELKVEATISQALLALNINENIDKQYYKYNLTAMKDYVFSNANGNTQFNLNAEKVWNFILVLPPLLEQKRIADFLDSKVTKIDKIISETKESIGNYKEYKQSVITEAVTKGLDKNVPMKDSGIEWIGKIPCEWQVAKLKHSIKWKSVKGNPKGTVLSLYRDYGVIPKDSRDDNHNVTSLDTFTYKVVDVGDFVINKMKAWQGSMAISEYNGIISPAYHICQIINPNIYKKYFHYLLRNHLYLPEYTRLSTGMRIGQWDLGYDDFKNLPFIIPTYDEQVEIAKYLDNKCAEIDNLIAEKEKLITNLEDYKKSLIYEYVTGKKAVE